MGREREITEPVDLCDARGRLNPAAVGWSRRPLHRANLRGWGRNKRWEYWGIVTPTHVIGITVSSIDYAGVNGVYVLDRATGTETEQEAITPFGRGVQLPESFGGGPIRLETNSLRIAIDEVDGGTSLRASSSKIELEIVAERPPGHESLGVVVPWSSQRFQYTVKDVARRARGRIIVAGVEHPVDHAFAVLDHGRGRWPYAITWNWGAGSGVIDGRVIGLQIGGKWTDGTGSTENSLLVGDRIHKISDELTWVYDRSNWLQSWRITGPRLDATFRPFHERRTGTNLVVLSNETHQCFGHYEGWVLADDGEKVDLGGLVGWAEEVQNRW